MGYAGCQVNITRVVLLVWRLWMVKIFLTWITFVVESRRCWVYFCLGYLPWLGYKLTLSRYRILSKSLQMSWSGLLFVLRRYRLLLNCDILLVLIRSDAIKICFNFLKPLNFLNEWASLKVSLLNDRIIFLPFLFFIVRRVHSVNYYV